MKKFNLFIIVIGAIILASCQGQEGNMLTEVQSDGSIKRSLLFKADSAQMVKAKPIPIIQDSGWTINWSYGTLVNQTNWPLTEWVQDTSVKTDPIIKATKTYSSVKQLEDEFTYRNTCWNDMQLQYELKKKFLWFYTEYSFKEVYPNQMIFTLVPLEDYMTEQEIRYYLQGDDELVRGMNGMEVKLILDKLDDKFSEFIQKNEYENLIDLIMEYSEKKEDISIKKQEIIAVKDTLAKLIQQKKEMHLDSSFYYLDILFKTNQFSILKEDTNFLRDSKELEDYSKSEFSMNYKLLMPGKVTKSNTNSMHGDTLFWKIDIARFGLLDYEIHAQSRKTNLWAYIITALILLLSFGLYRYKKRLSID